MSDEVLLHDIHCPYCGEPLQIEVDTSIEEQRYIEDCQVCCRPIELLASIDSDGAVRVEARHEDD